MIDPKTKISCLRQLFVKLLISFIILPNIINILYHDFSTQHFLLASASRVIEMNDKIVDIYQTDHRAFLIKFYAPWCHHCQELEPAWTQVAQQLSTIDPNIIVGRIDCTRYSSATSHFQIKGFPTIIYINRDKKVEYRGDRSVSEIVDFALRITGPPLRYLSNCDRLQEFTGNGHRPVFINFGPTGDGNFTKLSQTRQAYDWFYRSMLICDGFEAGIYVLKGDNIIKRFDPTIEPLENWVLQERFSQFNKFTPNVLSMAIQLKKLLVIAIVNEYRQTNRIIDDDNLAFQRLMETIANTYPNQHRKYLFGWSSDHLTMNSIVMHTIQPVPNLIVLNSTTIQYYLFEDGTKTKDGKSFRPSQSSIVQWLDDIIYRPNTVKALGGDGYHHRFYRAIYDLISFFINLWLGNPTLTLFVICVSSAFLSVLIYLMCCSEWLGVENEEDEFEDEVNEDEEVENEDDNNHEKIE